MSTTKKKIGDRIRITGGRHKNRVGVITGKERRGWTVELAACPGDSGEHRQINVPFPLAAPVEASAQVEQAGGEQAQEAAGDESPVAEAPQEADPTAPDEAEPTPETQEGGQNITKLTVKQLQALAKQRGIGIARTKADFLRIIKAKDPDEDLQRLKGKALFNRVGELHISRLRSKDDLLRLLQAS